MIDFQLEVSDLPRRGPGGRATGPPRRPLSARQHAVRLASVLLALVLLLGDLPGTRAIALALLAGPASVSASTSDRYYVDTGVPWGSITLDGHPLLLPRIGEDPPLQLAPGHHKIELRADPFLPVRCAFTVPRARADTCPYTPALAERAGSGLQIITLGESLATLSAAPRTSLVAAIQTALDNLRSVTTVEPGERYLEGGQVTTAARPLQAVLSFHLIAGGAPLACERGANPVCALVMHGCQVFCTVPIYLDGQYNSQLTPVWVVIALVTSTWDYIAPDGQRIAQTGNPMGELPGALMLGITRAAGGWRVVADLHEGVQLIANVTGASGDYDPTCLDAQVALASATRAGPASLLSWLQGDALAWQYAAAPEPAEGCVAVGLRVAPAGAAPAALAPAPVFLERCGVLLAVNALAHAILPGPPQADADERALAQQLTSERTSISAIPMSIR